MIPVSEETEKRICAMFSPREVEFVRDVLLNDCGDNLPLVDSSYAQLAERIRFAVLRLSQGDVERLEQWIDQSKTDWRDVLVAAGFAQGVEDHLKWWPE